jgi:hypothetical protein
VDLLACPALPKYLWENKVIRADVIENKITKDALPDAESSFTATLLQTLAIDAQTWFDSPL